MYKNMDAAVDMFHGDVGRIGIVIDSDMDGACSAAITYMLCKEYHPDVEPIIFVHTGKQHGCTDLLPDILAANINLLIIPDAGSSEVDACRELYEYGIKVIILDHHIIEKENKHAVVVNPYRADNAPNINTDISGTGVVEKFACALGSNQSFKDLVAISLISDICSLR